VRVTDRLQEAFLPSASERIFCKYSQSQKNNFTWITRESFLAPGKGDMLLFTLLVALQTCELLSLEEVKFS
jgi:hypothetical protein